LSRKIAFRSMLRMMKWCTAPGGSMRACRAIPKRCQQEIRMSISHERPQSSHSQSSRRSGPSPCGCPVARPSPQSRHGVSCIMRARRSEMEKQVRMS
jgi:hypothetical protein